MDKISEIRAQCEAAKRLPDNILRTDEKFVRQLLENIEYLLSEMELQKRRRDAGRAKRAALSAYNALSERHAEEIAALRAEQDAAVADLYKSRNCLTCKYAFTPECIYDNAFNKCKKFEWRGQQGAGARGSIHGHDCSGLISAALREGGAQ